MMIELSPLFLIHSILIAHVSHGDNISAKFLNIKEMPTRPVSKVLKIDNYRDGIPKRKVRTILLLTVISIAHYTRLVIRYCSSHLKDSYGVLQR